MLPSIVRSSTRSLRSTASRTAGKSMESGSKMTRATSASRKVAAKSLSAAYRPSVYEQARSYHVSKRMWAEKEEAAKEEAAAEEVEEQVGPMTAEEAAKLKADLKVAQKALEETAKALADTKDKLHRSLADLENTVRIAKKDVANAKEFGIKGFAMKMFDVLDTVELCLGNLPKPADVESNSHLESAIIALDSTKKQFAKVMADFEVHPLETKVGDKFDANVHNAVFEMQPTHADHKPHHVGVIIKHGWSRQGNLLRPTHVGVVAKH